MQSGMVLSCIPITVQDVERTEYVYGKSVPELKGKSTTPRNAHNRIVPVEKLSDKIQILYCDIMFVNNISFLISVAKPMNLILCSSTDNSRVSKLLGDTIMTQVNLMRSQQFMVNQIYVDD